ncbi:MAG TPA: hypothetical protein VFA05_08575 [Gaiellaceae bacterium]|nr:hypothetical protein [Gaiellaceae bacterium]
MRRVLLLIALLAFAAPATGARDRPTLRVVTPKPFVVAGRAFAPHERIRLTVVSGGFTRTAVARSSSSGSFTSNLGTVPVSRCERAFVRARGALGDSATARYPVQLPQCMPASAQ